MVVRQNNNSRTEERTILMTDYDAFLFDLDGVVTQSMKLHASAWKMLFDDYLRERSQKLGDSFVPFDDHDYRTYVDGKLRYEGVSSFLQSRGITLPQGDPADAPNLETVCGLGNKKNRYFHRQIETQGVDVFGSSVKLIREARAQGMKTAVVSSSKNCKLIIESVGIDKMFDVRVDGVEVEYHGLPGKPAPDMFLEAAKRLGVVPRRAVVFEDAISGVMAGRRGGFGLVVGVDRTGHPDDLRENGADLVVGDLGELSLV